MSKAGYDGETCDSCRDKMICGAWEAEEVKSDTMACNSFAPSLQCRQVRAEEEANRLREEQNRCLRIASSALERIADSMGVREPESEKPREPRKRKTRDCEYCKGQGVIDGFGALCLPCGGLGAVLIER